MHYLNKLSDFWMPIMKKIEAAKHGFTKLLLITPQATEDIMTCPIAGDDLQIVMQYADLHSDPTKFVALFMGNFQENAFALTGQMMTAA